MGSGRRRLKELYLYFVDVNHNVQGNPDLKAEDSHNVNLSFQYNRETNKSFIGTGAELLSITTSTILSPLPRPQVTLYTYINVDKYITQGAQLVLNYRLYPWLNIRSGAGITGRYNSLSDESGSARKFYYSPDAVITTTYHLAKSIDGFYAGLQVYGKDAAVLYRQQG